MTKVFSTTFFAHKDTRTPLIGGIISIISNLLFIIILVPYMKHIGIALATSLASWINGLYLIFKLSSLKTVSVDRQTIYECIKQLFISFLMFLAIYFMNIYADSYYALEGINRNIAVIIVSIISIFVFFIAGKLFGSFKCLKEINTLK